VFIIEIWVKLTCAKIGREKVLTLKSGSVLAAPITNPGSNFLPIKVSPSINQYMYACMQLGGGLPPTVIGGGSKDSLGD